MQKLALLTLLTAGFMIAATAQEEAETPTETAAAEDGQAEAAQAEPDAAEDAEEDVDDALLDDEFYQDADDEDFRPSEDIPADQSITFPTDI